MTDLLPSQRQAHILRQLRSTGAVRVSDLADELSVAEETIRRDLKVMDDDGILHRTHGGAVPANELQMPSLITDLPFEQRRQMMLPQKQKIAQAALKRIQPGSTIALDGSTTAFELAKLLEDAKLKVITNSLMIVNLLSARGGPTIISTGGTLDRELMMFTGMIAIDSARSVHVDTFFCSCGGADARRGFSDPSESAAQFKREMIRAARQSIVLADSSKFDARAPVVFARPTDIDELITDASAPRAALRQLKKSGLRCTAVSESSSPLPCTQGRGSG